MNEQDCCNVIWKSKSHIKVCDFCVEQAKVEAIYDFMLNNTIHVCGTFTYACHFNSLNLDITFETHPFDTRIQHNRVQ